MFFIREAHYRLFYLYRIIPAFLPEAEHTQNTLSHFLSREGSKFKLSNDVRKSRPEQERRDQRLQVMREIVGGKGKF